MSRANQTLSEKRPPTFTVTSSNTTSHRNDEDSFPLLGRQESLLPGEVHTPAERPTPLLDWTRGDSLMWDTPSRDETKCTPLGGYGRDDDLWNAARSSSQQSHALATDADVAAVRSTLQSLNISSSNPPAANGVAVASAFTVQHANDPTGAMNQLSRQESTDSNFLLRYRSQSEILSDELHFQAKTFPPPPPPNAPIETRRIRAELWYVVARKWDITQQMPPPPRSPLPGMEEEHRSKLQELTRVPYRGDRWLAQSDHWFHWIQDIFAYPDENCEVPIATDFVLSMVA